MPEAPHRYDVIITGAGATGAEAAWRLADAGMAVALITTSLDTVYAAPRERARPGGPPGTLADVLAQELPAAEDGTVAAWDLHAGAKYRLEARPEIHLLQSNVDALETVGGRVTGVQTWEGVPHAARAVALCVGSFLRARLRIGAAEEAAGRPGEMAYDDLADDLAARGVRLSEARDEGGGGEEGPAWELRFLTVAPEEREGTRLVRLPGCFIAGVCARGPLDVAEATAEGLRLAEDVRAWLQGPGRGDASGPQ